MNSLQEIKPFSYRGQLTIPASKSYLQRAIAIAALCEEPCVIQNFYPSHDALAALTIAESLGASISKEKDQIKIQKGVENFDKVILNCGESGLSTRMFSPIAALFNRKSTIIGHGSLLQRPIDMIEDALNQFGVKTQSNSGRIPLEIYGPMRPSHARIDGSESSQLLTGLLIALPYLKGDSLIYVDNLKSKPYIQMTLDILQDFGVEIVHEHYKRFEIRGSQRPTAKHYFVEGDWSGAALHAVGAAISGEVELKGLNPNSAQADRAILDALALCGAQIDVQQAVIRISKQQLNAFQFDATHCPDLFPPLAVLAAACEGTSEIIGVSRLTHKESNRALTLQSEFAKLNIRVDLDGDIMRIGKSEVCGGAVDSHNDHRIAMACATLATLSSSAVTIHNSQAVNKSYPTFFEDLALISEM